MNIGFAALQDSILLIFDKKTQMNVYLGSDCTKIKEDLFIEIDQEIYITYQKKNINCGKCNVHSHPHSTC